ncbi:aminoglycoside 6-adenylyltransferase [Alkalicoccobacillus gibsonii]|uniref:aminoglycoside 6-adenylyltransferase n=1 Tax=Alkalicoccobacillus gibsonii TaxID=79881 RepID=UPI003F7B9FAE
MGLESKHTNRDLELSKHRTELVTRICDDLVEDDRILAVFFGGSIGNETTDTYSDIDVRIVVRDEDFESFRSRKRERAQCWGNVLFFEDVPWTNYSVAHYDTFLKVDSFYYRKRDLEPSVWLKNIRIVADSGGFMSEIVEESRDLRYKPSVGEVELLRSKFLAHSHEIYCRVSRGEWNYALNCLNYLRMIVVTAWYMDKEIQPNALGDWAKYEGARSWLDQRQLQALAEWDGCRDKDEIMRKVRIMFGEFKVVHRSLCEKVGMDEEQEMLERVMGMVL